MLLDAITQHIPADLAWLPAAGTGATALFGLILMLKGAKLAPAMAAIAFALAGGVGGSFLAHQLGTQPWPTMITTGVIGLVLGVVCFRLWLAALVAASTVLIGLTVYAGTVLLPHLVSFSSPQIEEVQLLRQPGESTAAVEWRGLWEHLAASVPNFETSVWAIIASTGLAGFLVGFLMPRISRALWASSTGTALVFGTAIPWLQSRWPDVINAIHPQWQVAIATVVWALSLLLNFRDLRPPKVLKPAEAPTAATATA
jgi:hypothetical protein